MHTAAFEALVLEALNTLPPEFAQHLANVEVQVMLRPTQAQLQAVGLGPAATLYGLYEGVPLPQRSGGAVLMPDMITIFQEAIERDFPEPEALRRQVRRTVLHELAHFFGISDQRLHELDAY